MGWVFFCVTIIDCVLLRLCWGCVFNSIWFANSSCSLIGLWSVNTSPTTTYTYIAHSNYYYYCN